MLPGAVVRRVETHPEFERYELELDGDEGTLTVEAVVSRAGFDGVCQAGGVTLFPRWELRTQEQPEELETPPIAELCRRLRAAPPDLRRVAGTPEARHQEVREGGGRLPPRVRGAVGWGPMHGVLWGLLVALAVASPTWWGGLRRLGRAERLELAAVLVGGLVARLALSPLFLFNGANAAFEKLEIAWGHDLTEGLYGSGFGALYGLPAALSGADPWVVLWLQRLVAAAAPPLLWCVLRLAVGRTAALAGGVALALLPVHLLLSGTEVMLIPVVTLQLLSVAAALGYARTGAFGLAAVAVLAVVFAANIRPEVIPSALLPVVAVALFGRRATWRSSVTWVALAALVVAIAVRALALPDPGGARGVMKASDLLDPWFLAQMWLPNLSGEGRFQTFLSLTWTSPLLWGLALVGLLTCRWRVRLLALAWFVLVLVAVLPKSFPIADVLRLQLPGQVPWLILAAAGAERLGRLVAWLPGPLIAVAALPHLGAVRIPWVHQHEAVFLLQAVRQVPPGARVVFDDATPRDSKRALVLRELAPDSEWVGASQGVRDGDLVLLGVTCLSQEAAPTCVALRRCRLEPWRTARLPTETDLDLHLIEPPVVGLFRARDCPR